MWIWWMIVGAVCIGSLIGFAIFSQWALRNIEKQARRRFNSQKERLHADFFKAASESGKPKGLRWRECQWEPWVQFVRHRQTRELAALQALTILFEAVEGGDMEDVAAVNLPRNASAVFFYHSGKWHTLGKVIMNKNPDEAAEHFANIYDRLEEQR